MIDTGGAEHERTVGMLSKSCARRTGVDMVSPPEGARNAERAQSEGRAPQGRGS